VTAPSDEPTEVEQQVIDEMTAAHPTWTARRHLNGWSICEGEVPVLAWDPDIAVAVRAAERAIRPTPEEELAALRADFSHSYVMGHDSDGTWWAVRRDATTAPLEADSAGRLRIKLEIDDRSSV
jgi:hypothetical protein